MAARLIFLSVILSCLPANHETLVPTVEPPTAAMSSFDPFSASSDPGNDPSQSTTPAAAPAQPPETFDPFTRPAEVPAAPAPPAPASNGGPPFDPFDPAAGGQAEFDPFAPQSSAPPPAHRPPPPPVPPPPAHRVPAALDPGDSELLATATPEHELDDFLSGRVDPSPSQSGADDNKAVVSVEDLDIWGAPGSDGSEGRDGGAAEEVIIFRKAQGPI